MSKLALVGPSEKPSLILLQRLDGLGRSCSLGGCCFSCLNSDSDSDSGFVWSCFLQSGFGFGLLVGSDLRSGSGSGSYCLLV